MTLSERCLTHASKAEDEGWYTTRNVLQQASIELEQRDELLWFAKQIIEGVNSGNIKIDSDVSPETLGNILKRGSAAIKQSESALTKAGAN
ncbi:MAG: hypothetical protein KIT15_16950 [Xanthobacteraceae bacterium]|nr:hypothetical protein [Xanthobacteraceae bacterium]